MAISKPFKVNRLITAMKKAGFTTRDDIKNLATKKDIQDELVKFYVDRIKPIMATKDDLNSVRNELRAAQRHIQRQFPDLKFDTPPRGRLTN